MTERYHTVHWLHEYNITDKQLEIAVEDTINTSFRDSQRIFLTRDKHQEDERSGARTESLLEHLSSVMKVFRDTLLLCDVNIEKWVLSGATIS